jgi:hypothetical protein
MLIHSFLIVAIIVAVRQYQVVILIYISLKINDGKLLSMYLSAILSPHFPP